jgi:hypothetical protein
MAMKIYSVSRKDVVAFVSAELKSLKPGYALTITTEPEKSGGYCVISAIDGWLDAIKARNSSRTPTST